MKRITLYYDPQNILSESPMNRRSQRFPGVGILHKKDGTVVRPSHLFDGEPYTGKTAS